VVRFAKISLLKMLVHNSLQTGIRILLQQSLKIGNNRTYTKTNPTEVFNGFCLIDENVGSFKGKIISDYGIDMAQAFIIYLDTQNVISRLNLPEFEIEWNTDFLHKNNPFDPTLDIFSVKVIDINTPHGLLLSHTELLVISNF
jgi:hypothetical protein